MDRTAYRSFLRLDRNHFWRIAKRRLVLETLERRLGPARGLRILDIGGGASLLPGCLRKWGSVVVIEPDRATRDIARELSGLEILAGSLPDDLPVSGPFDVITLLDVLEHIDSDGSALERIRELLGPGGVLICTVPALMALWSPHDVSLHHRRRYSRAGLRRTMEGAGFRVLRLTFHTSFLFPVLAAQRLLQRARADRRPPGYRVRIPPRPINAMLGAVMSGERRILRLINLPIGSSLLAVAEAAPPESGRPSRGV